AAPCAVNVCKLCFHCSACSLVIGPRLKSKLVRPETNCRVYALGSGPAIVGACATVVAAGRLIGWMTGGGLEACARSDGDWGRNSVSSAEACSADAVGAGCVSEVFASCDGG